MDPEGPDATALIKLLVAHHVAVTSTLPVFEGAVAGRQTSIGSIEVGKNADLVVI
jgi:cytosine/adenosine deaminase-related metal-dependent hydrolase